MPTRTSTEDELREKIVAELDRAYEAKVQTYGAPVVRHIEKAIMLQQLDTHWREHLAAMDYLRQGIHLRSYAQKNPKQEYKREAFELFTTMLDRVKHDTVSLLSRMQLRTQADIDAEEEERQRRLARAMQFQHAAPEQLTAAAAEQGPRRRAAAGSHVGAGRAVRARDEKVGRNEPCPCGSGKKYKHCHGALAREGLTVKPRSIHVVAGALFDAAGRVLIAQRPPGKHMAGGWEFPGGKLDPRRERLAPGSRASCARNSGSSSRRNPLIAYEHTYPERQRAARSVAREPLQRRTRNPLDGRRCSWVTLDEPRRCRPARGRPADDCCPARAAQVAASQHRTFVHCGRARAGRGSPACSAWAQGATP